MAIIIHKEERSQSSTAVVRPPLCGLSITPEIIKPAVSMLPCVGLVVSIVVSTDTREFALWLMGVDDVQPAKFGSIL